MKSRCNIYFHALTFPRCLDNCLNNNYSIDTLKKIKKVIQATKDIISMPLLKLIHIRKATAQDASSLAKTHVESWRSAYKGVIPQSYLDRLSYKEREAMWTDILSQQNNTSIQLVAVDEDNTIIGFVAGGEAREAEFGYDSELYALYLLPEYQGQGIGKKLLRYLTEWLIQNGYHKLYLWVLEKNKTRYFYEKLGAKKLEYSRTESFDDQQFIEIVYGWNNLNELLEKTTAA
jgi:GNAT superfamily N-acetyltransferase